jgi:hypothetical protein
VVRREMVSALLDLCLSQCLQEDRLSSRGKGVRVQWGKMKKHCRLMVVIIAGHCEWVLCH